MSTHLYLRSLLCRRRPQGHDGVLAASKTTIKELRNVHVPDSAAALQRGLQPLGHHTTLRTLTLCRASGEVDGLAMPITMIVLCTLPTSLEV